MSVSTTTDEMMQNTKCIHVSYSKKDIKNLKDRKWGGNWALIIITLYKIVCVFMWDSICAYGKQ